MCRASGQQVADRVCRNLLAILLSSSMLSCNAQSDGESGVSASTAGPDEVKGEAPETVRKVSDMTAALSWSFNVSEKVLPTSADAARDAPEEQIRYEFVSREPIRKTERGMIFLRADYTASQFDNAARANRYFTSLAATAHPDMGLSYAWDYLLLHEDELHHLHAACTFPEAEFRKIIGGLREMLGGVAATEQQLYCSCGRGCGPSL